MRTINIIIICAITAPIILFAVAMFVLITNEAFGEVTPYGEPYVHSYCYCDVTAYGGKGLSYCRVYKTGQEMRQKTHVTGLFFDTESSKLVVKQ